MFVPDKCEYRENYRGFSVFGSSHYPAGTEFLPGDEPGPMCSKTGERCEKRDNIVNVDCPIFDQTKILCPVCREEDLLNDIEKRFYFKLIYDVENKRYFCDECDFNESVEDRIKKIKRTSEDLIEQLSKIVLGGRVFPSRNFPEYDNYFHQIETVYNCTFHLDEILGKHILKIYKGDENWPDYDDFREYNTNNIIILLKDYLTGDHIEELRHLIKLKIKEDKILKLELEKYIFQHI